MSLDGHYDPENIFAKIIRGDIPSAKVYEDDQVLSFMDAFPQSRGHTLVIPKLPFRNLFDIGEAELCYLIQKTQLIAGSVNKALTPDGIIITQFNGAPAGQTVFHLHFHIIPSYSHETLESHAKGQMADISDLKMMASQIAAHLK